MVVLTYPMNYKENHQVKQQIWEKKKYITHLHV